jgi:hypothetical protein
MLGKKVVTQHIRDGKELAPLGERRYYDFNYQVGARGRAGVADAWLGMAAAQTATAEALIMQGMHIGRGAHAACATDGWCTWSPHKAGCLCCPCGPAGEHGRVAWAVREERPTAAHEAAAPASPVPCAACLTALPAPCGRGPRLAGVPAGARLHPARHQHAHARGLPHHHVHLHGQRPHHEHDLWAVVL